MYTSDGYNLLTIVILLPSFASFDMAHFYILTLMGLVKNSQVFSGAGGFCERGSVPVPSRVLAGEKNGLNQGLDQHIVAAIGEPKDNLLLHNCMRCCMPNGTIYGRRRGHSASINSAAFIRNRRQTTLGGVLHRLPISATFVRLQKVNSTLPHWRP
jgi:hypothetical protein